MQTASDPTVRLEPNLRAAYAFIPGLLVGVTCLLIAAVSLSASGDNALLWQIADRNSDGHTPLSSVAGALRLHRGQYSPSDDRPVIESATDTLRAAQKVLAVPDLLTAVDRVIITIPLAGAPDSNSDSPETGRQMAQLLSRRMARLRLRAIVRVRRAEDLPEAMDLTEAMLREGNLSADQISIGLDPDMDAHMLAIEVLRSIRPVVMQERRP